MVPTALEAIRVFKKEKSTFTIQMHTKKTQGGGRNHEKDTEELLGLSFGEIPYNIFKKVDENVDGSMDSWTPKNTHES